MGGYNQPRYPSSFMSQQPQQPQQQQVQPPNGAMPGFNGHRGPHPFHSQQNGTNPQSFNQQQPNGGNYTAVSVCFCFF